MDRLQALNDLLLNRIGVDLAGGAPRGEIGGRAHAGRLGIGIHSGHT